MLCKASDASAVTRCVLQEREGDRRLDVSLLLLFQSRHSTRYRRGLCLLLQKSVMLSSKYSAIKRQTR